MLVLQGGEQKQHPFRKTQVLWPTNFPSIPAVLRERVVPDEAETAAFQRMLMFGQEVLMRKFLIQSRS